MTPRRLVARILRGVFRNVAFTDLIRMLEALGFRESGGGASRRVFVRAGVTALVNPQDEKGEAKHYQAPPIVTLVRQYNLELEEGQ